MDHMGKELRFKITRYTPKTIPMARLAEYLTKLALILGHEDNVHFECLDEGSVEVVHRIDSEAWPKVEQQIHDVGNGNGPEKAMTASRSLEKLLREDNSDGFLMKEDTAVILNFPGISRPAPIDYGPLTEAGSLEGVPIKIGGKDDKVTVTLQDVSPGELIYNCKANRNTAKAISQHLFEATVRVHGTGKWARSEFGIWELKSFLITDFEVLDDAPLDMAIKDLRAIPGSGWDTVQDPIAELHRIRYGEDNTH